MRYLNLWTCLMVLCATVPARAEDENKLTATFMLTTDYRFRGVSQDDGSLTPQGELDWNGENGWSVGAFASKVDFDDHEDTSVEFAFYGNKHFDWNGTGIDLTANYYAYPNHRPRRGSVRYSSVEFTGEISQQWDALTINGTAALSPNFFGEGHAVYVAVGASYAFTDWLSGSANAGVQWAHEYNSVADGGYPYTHWDAGFTATHENMSLDLRYIGSSLSRNECFLTQGGTDWCGSIVVATLSYHLEGL